jgi:dihydropyrimidinase
MSPPFRNKKHRDSLRAGLQSGRLSVVATDHATFTKQQKRMGLKNFTQIPNGTGIPRTVISRGKVAWEQGDMRAKAGDGDFVARKPNAPVHQANAIWKGLTQPKGVKRVEVVP